ncbi:MAG: hypothetical protein AUJ49_01015 [Desulfovibrionaceae bacterium CG1_02_65_16]|nr:MAG: hypothetical protein AUJ49_01015 [Desulfovibrionaceae bacterium CG1_02_65_16]
MTSQRHARGFTLVEVIATLILAGLFAMMLASYLSKDIVFAHVPFQRLQKAAELSNAMEAVIRDDETMTTKTAADLTALAAKVNNFNANYGAYCATCTGSAATTTVGLLPDAILVTITNSQGETASHVFTVQNY